MLDAIHWQSERPMTAREMAVVEVLHKIDMLPTVELTPDLIARLVHDLDVPERRLIGAAVALCPNEGDGYLEAGPVRLYVQQYDPPEYPMASLYADGGDAAIEALVDSCDANIQSEHLLAVGELLHLDSGVFVVTAVEAHGKIVVAELWRA